MRDLTNEEVGFVYGAGLAISPTMSPKPQDHKKHKHTSNNKHRTSHNKHRTSDKKHAKTSDNKHKQCV